ncbi:MAG: flagellar basal body-associated protein FliL [Hyphococcus sp.]|nr:MAG: flagellar basal body-associated protein FliL [Marinicaulis sp.]
MIKFVPILLQLIGVSAGAFLGVTLKGSPTSGALTETGSSHAAEAKDDAHGKEPKKEKKKKDKKKKKKKPGHGDKKSKGHGGGGHGGDSSNGDSAFLKFSRQFIVPVIKSNGVNSLVVIDINLEVEPSISETAYSREPKLRDALLSALLKLSNNGAFNDQFLHQENIDAIRGSLLASAQSVLHEDVKDVLILSISRQDL